MQKDEYSEQTTKCFFKEKTLQFFKKQLFEKNIKVVSFFFGTIQSNWKVEIKKEKNGLKKLWSIHFQLAGASQSKLPKGRF